ncbi:MAG: Nramp family divalent metal transporter [Bryobacterales bacterium]|nr:Nramp family divalent metal transporter [Bryobacteraceae bacterium]MDW8129765.1 Nramp family divalent metal transporter [Bryobacterales bacterium]
MIRTRPIPRRPRSLPEVHASVGTSHPSIWRRMFAFAGPAYLVSVGYMDPGNWATDLEAGARFGYQLLWVLVMSNAMAILLQTLSARLGIVTGRDLAQACADTYPPFINYALWFLCEIAIAACDMAELLGAAIALNLLFGIPLLWGVFITAADTLLLLGLSRYGIRIIEGIVLSMVTVIAGCMFVEIWLARPAAGEVASGLIPRLSGDSLYVAIAILGATVMPHNLYLHSALVQTRRIGRTSEDKRRATRYNLVDSVVALNGALLVNAAILILAATVFFRNGVIVTEIQQAHQLLAPLLGTTLASIAFGVALLLSGQSSTMTGTMAGQIVMEGFLNIRMRPWLRRLITRLIAITPAAITIAVAGDEAVLRLLILSQVILSMQLPFAVIPLIHLTSDRQRMGLFANPAWVRALAWIVAAIIVALNVRLLVQTAAGWLVAAGERRWLVELGLYPVAAALLAVLAWVTLEPWLPGWLRQIGRVAPAPLPVELEPRAPVFRTILAPVDHTEMDRAVVSVAAGLAREHQAKLYLLHVEEDVTSLIYGELSQTAEVEAGRQYLDDLAAALREQGVDVQAVLCHSRDPRREIVRFARQVRPDLVVMGGHGHKWLQDLVFGGTIDSVRHALGAPVLIVPGTAVVG